MDARVNHIIGGLPVGDLMTCKSRHWGLKGLIYVPSGSDPPQGNPRNSVSFWQKWHTHIDLSEERVSVASSG